MIKNLILIIDLLLNRSIVCDDRVPIVTPDSQALHELRFDGQLFFTSKRVIVAGTIRACVADSVVALLAYGRVEVVVAAGLIGAAISRAAVPRQGIAVVTHLAILDEALLDLNPAVGADQQR